MGGPQLRGLSALPPLSTAPLMPPAHAPLHPLSPLLPSPSPAQVAKHLDKLQKEKEERGLEKLRALAPTLGGALRATALEECQWDEERALHLLRRFQVAHADELGTILKARRKHEADVAEAAREAARAGGDGDGGGGGSGSESSSSGSDSDSDSDSGGRGKGSKRRRSSKKGKKDKDSRKKARRSGGGKKGKKDKDKDRRRDKKRAKPAKPRVGAVEDYGKYGVVRESDMYAKRPEFQLWAMEVKKCDVEAMPRFEEKELFK